MTASCARAAGSPTSAAGAVAARPLTSYRFVLGGCQPDHPAVKLPVATADNPNAVYALHLYPAAPSR